MSKPLTMTVEQWDTLCKAVTKSRSADLLDTFKELAAVRAALAAAEAMLEQERVRLAGCGVVAMSDTPESAAIQRAAPGAYGHSASMDDVARRVDECMDLRAALAAAEAALADERRHADALKEGLAACVGERATFYAGQTQTVTWAVAIEHAERLLSEHRARRAHDSECESEFDSQVHAQTPCGCAARRAAEVSRDRP